MKKHKLTLFEFQKYVEDFQPRKVIYIADDSEPMYYGSYLNAEFSFDKMIIRYCPDIIHLIQKENHLTIHCVLYVEVAVTEDNVPTAEAKVYCGNVYRSKVDRIVPLRLVW